MEDYPRPRLVVSRCLGFESCRYNDQVIRDSFVAELRNYADCITPCPEADIGLGVPRFPVRLVQRDNQVRLLQSESEKDCTEDMVSFSEAFLKKNRPVDGFILKYRSPSCGQKEVKIYPRLGKVAPLGKGPGIFTREVEKYYPDLPLENEGRLKNYKIRYRFYSRIFTLARFRGVKAAENMKHLVEFQARHKFLLLAYDEQGMRDLGRIVANQEGLAVGEVLDKYAAKLRKTLTGQSTRKTNINVMMHMGGYFSETNSKREKDYLEESFELYREGRIPLSSVLSIIRTWALRDQNDYLLNQYYLTPFPQDLLELKDSGRQIEL